MKNQWPHRSVTDFFGLPVTDVSGSHHRSLIAIVVAFLAVTGWAAEKELSWMELRDQFWSQVRDPALAGKTLLEIGRLGESAATGFLIEAFNHPAMYPGYAEEHYPEKNFKSAHTIAGMAQVALAMLGDEERWGELEAETRSDEWPLRANALQKIKHIPGERALGLLSSYLGDTEQQGDVLDLLEWEALFELTRRLKDPPFSIREPRDLHPGYYSDGGREKWLQWRYKNYGPIPGREELFAQFASDPGENTEPTALSMTEEHVEPVVASPVTDAVNGDEELSTKSDEGTLKQPEALRKTWPLWMLGCLALVVIAVLGFRKLNTSK